MLSRQARAGIAVLAAISLVVLFLHHGGYDLDRYAIVGSQLPPKALNTDFDKTASLTSSNMDEQDIHNTAENRIHPASPTSSSAVQRSPVPTPEHDNSVYDLSSIDWSRYAYVQYVTNEAYLCNALMIFETLHRLGSKADRVMMYPDYMLRDPTMTQSEGTGSSRELLTKASDEYGVILIPIEVQHRDSPDFTWSDSYTKLLAFNPTHYDRVLAFDSDALLLQPMDELFLMPSCPIAMPRAYWLMKEKPPKKILSTHIMLLEPSKIEFARLQSLIHNAKDDEFDMEIVNKLYLNSAAVLPHRPYGLLTAEFRLKDHNLYLGSDIERWSPRDIVREVKLVHFSDWPVQKPWLDIHDEEGLRRKHQPHCKTTKGKKRDCLDRDVWNSLYTDFGRLRQRVCFE